MGLEYVVGYRRGRLELTTAGVAAEKDTTVFVAAGTDLFRAVAGHHRGELLRVVRDEQGEAKKLYLATYPLTRTPGRTRRPDDRRAGRDERDQSLGRCGDRRGGENSAKRRSTTAPEL